MSEQVVELQDMGSDVVQIKMQDRIHKNTFSEGLTRGLIESFAKIKTTNAKVVILTGYDNYFATGGTQDALLFLSEGKGKFTDTNLYSLALDCSVPVISAMQGHGIGGGFVMGMFADFVVMGKECIYTTNFMKYGFTPGMGATLILPQKLGFALAHEMLLAARTFRGEDLQKRGIAFPVIARSDVGEYALELALNLAEKPRLSLVTLKDHLVSSLRAQLPETTKKEVAMHEITFHQKEVKENIQSLF